MKYYKQKDFWISAIISISFLFLSLIVNFYAGTYATESISNSVTDIILSNTAVHDFDTIFVYGMFVFVTFIILVCLYRPNKIPFVCNTIALFVIIRSVFISLTHIGPFPNAIIINPQSVVNLFTFGGDLFFSAHTGLPFLMMLVFWDYFWLRVLFFISSIFFGIVVLLAHLHYSIDVLSAFFITYSIFCIAIRLFKHDLKLFKQSYDDGIESTLVDIPKN